MSGMSSIGGFGFDANQQHPRAVEGRQGDRCAARRAPAEGGGDRRGAMMERIESLASEAGLDSDAIAALQEDLRSAISAAVANANRTGESGDPREAARSAVQSTLEKYGIDLEQFARPEGSGAGRRNTGAVGPGNSGMGPEGQDLLAGLPTDPNQSILESLLDLLQVVDEEA